MRMLATLPILASVILQQAAAHGAAESLSFPGFLPFDYVKAPKPIGDDRPNDVYQHLKVRGPSLSPLELVIYPHHYGFEYGQDPEHKIYEVHNAKELQAEHNKKYGKKHSMNNKHGKHDHHKEEEKAQLQSHKKGKQQFQRKQEDEVPPAIQSSYDAPQQFRPRPAYSSNQQKVHPHFG